MAMRNSERSAKDGTVFDETRVGRTADGTLFKIVYHAISVEGEFTMLFLLKERGGNST